MDNNKCGTSNNPDAYSRNTSNVRNQSLLGIRKQHQCLYPEHHYEHSILNKWTYEYRDSDCCSSSYSTCYEYKTGVWMK